MDQFIVWCQGQDDVDDFEEVKKNFNELKFYVVSYLESYRVKDKVSKELVRPKTNTMNRIKSMLTTELSRLTGKFNENSFLSFAKMATSAFLALVVIGINFRTTQFEP